MFYVGLPSQFLFRLSVEQPGKALTGSTKGLRYFTFARGVCGHRYAPFFTAVRRPCTMQDAILSDL